MQLFNFIVTALTVSLVSLTASAEHKVNARHHQGLSRRVEGHLDRRATTNSKWSWYDTETGNAGSCGRTLKNSEFVVAMNVPQYQAGNCFKSITLSWHGKQTRAQIVDMCPGCPYGGLDLSPKLFEFFTPLGTGLLWDGTWWFDGDGPEGAAPPPPPKPTTSKYTWTPPPAPSTTKTTQWTPEWTPEPSTTWTETKTTSKTTTSSSTTTEEPKTTATTTTTSSSTTTTTTSSAAPVVTPASFRETVQQGNVGGINQVFVAMGNAAAAGAWAQ